ncbi:uncharacterized protein K441DRAFT_206971 [Cenococcum geophilum 1.58]|uniref:uncharacterized protein n=1 Tax=Cenococcum geophilum 1.58 TaxID=794803 RepID=UPI00358F030C|nr:hypothetical protein K441DRAFT_206971 [Cenococcum geophilum 1.58]
MSYPISQAVAVTSITFSFILVGIITAISPHSKNTSKRYKKRHHLVPYDSPSFAVDFPQPSSPKHLARTRLLGRQWPHCWTVGNRFFRPISTLGALGYRFVTWVTYRGDPMPKETGGCMRWPQLCMLSRLYTRLSTCSR